jgi:hypothetical protein
MSPGTELNQDSVSSGKGRPTPTRKEKEAARKRPLVANDRTERRRQERTATAALRERQRIGQANGEEKYLPIRDRGPQRRYVRDYVDARWSLGELLLPFIALFFIASFFPQFPAIVTVSILVMWAVLLVAAGDIIVLGFVLRKKLAAKFGSADRGVSFYAGLRSVYLRPMRLPKPQVKRGAFPA